MRRTVSDNQVQDLQSPLVKLATCWRIERGNGTPILGTDCAIDIEVTVTDPTLEAVLPGLDLAGVYRSQAGISGSDVHSSSDLSVDNLEVAGNVLKPDEVALPDITVADMESGSLDHAAVTVFFLNWEGPDRWQELVRRGHLGEFSRDDLGRYRTEVRGLVQLLSQNIGDTYSVGCNVKRFGDAQCKYPVEDVTSTGTVIAAGVSGGPGDETSGGAVAGARKRFVVSAGGLQDPGVDGSGTGTDTDDFGGFELVDEAGIRYHPGVYPWCQPGGYDGIPGHRWDLENQLNQVLAFIHNTVNVEPSIRGVQLLGVWATYSGQTRGDNAAGIAAIRAILNALAPGKRAMFCFQAEWFGDIGNPNTVIPQWALDEYGTVQFRRDGVYLRGFTAPRWQVDCMSGIMETQAAVLNEFGDDDRIEMFLLAGESAIAVDGQAGYSTVATSTQVNRALAAARTIAPHLALRWMGNDLGSDAEFEDVFDFCDEHAVMMSDPDTWPGDITQISRVYVGRNYAGDLVYEDRRLRMGFVANIDTQSFQGRWTLQQLWDLHFKGYDPSNGQFHMPALQSRYWNPLVQSYYGPPEMHWETGVLPFIRQKYAEGYPFLQYPVPPMYVDGAISTDPPDDSWIPTPLPPDEPSDGTAPPGLPLAALDYVGALVTFTTGDNAGFSREVALVENMDGVVAFVVWDEYPFDIEVGDTVTIVPDCDRKYETCRDVWHNLLNFRGHGIFMPGVDALTRGPTT